MNFVLLIIILENCKVNKEIHKEAEHIFFEWNYAYVMATSQKKTLLCY